MEKIIAISLILLLLLGCTVAPTESKETTLDSEDSIDYIETTDENNSIDNQKIDSGVPKDTNEETETELTPEDETILDPTPGEQIMIGPLNLYKEMKDKWEEESIYCINQGTVSNGLKTSDGKYWVKKATIDNTKFIAVLMHGNLGDCLGDTNVLTSGEDIIPCFTEIDFETDGCVAQIKEFNIDYPIVNPYIKTSNNNIYPPNRLDLVDSLNNFWVYLGVDGLGEYKNNFYRINKNMMMETELPFDTDFFYQPTHQNYITVGHNVWNIPKEPHTNSTIVKAETYESCRHTGFTCNEDPEAMIDKYEYHHTTLNQFFEIYEIQGIGILFGKSGEGIMQVDGNCVDEKEHDPFSGCNYRHYADFKWAFVGDNVGMGIVDPNENLWITYSNIFARIQKTTSLLEYPKFDEVYSIEEMEAQLN